VVGKRGSKGENFFQGQGVDTKHRAHPLGRRLDGGQETGKYSLRPKGEQVRKEKGKYSIKKETC